MLDPLAARLAFSEPLLTGTEVATGSCFSINKVVKRRNGFLCAVDEAGENILSLRKDEKKQGKFVQMEMSIFTAAHPLLHIRQAPIVLWF